MHLNHAFDRVVNGSPGADGWESEVALTLQMLALSHTLPNDTGILCFSMFCKDACFMLPRVFFSSTPMEEKVVRSYLQKKS